MLTFTDTQVLGWITPILWPFIRVLALFSTLPVIAQTSVPARVRIGLAFLVAFCAQATIPAIEPIELASAAGADGDIAGLACALHRLTFGHPERDTADDLRRGRFGIGGTRRRRGHRGTGQIAGH